MHDNETKFAVGAYVVSRFALPAPVGGCAQYRMVETKLTALCPQSIPPSIACSLPASSVAAREIAYEFVKQGDRVLVIGGSGGVGTSVLQYSRPKASYLATVSTQSDLCTRLGADTVIDYRSTNWWEVENFATNPFDVVIDLVNGGNWEGARQSNAVKRRGLYVALLAGVATEVHVHGVWDLVKLSCEWLWITSSSRLNPRVPTWVMADGLEGIDGSHISAVLADVVEGRLRPVLDPSSPFPFTEDGVKDAMKLQRSTHAHGKVVIEIAEN